MKIGQLYIVSTNKARAVITRESPSIIELRWTHESDGTLIKEGKRPILYKRDEIQKSIDNGQVTIFDPEGDPNLMFLMRKRS
jgi:hypothetical protein